MEKEFIPYEQALALKELGFDEPCLTYYNYDKRIERSDDWAYGCTLEDKRDRNECLAPLYQQAFRWFREKHNIDSYHIEPTNNMFGNFYGVLGLRTATFNGGFKTYEEAELACLKKLIEILKQK
jgi:hypothetical protein